MTHPSDATTDERLDRLIRDVLADRAEDVAAATASADAMAQRITTRLGPSRVGRGWVLLAAALLTTLAIGGALTAGGVVRLPLLPSRLPSLPSPPVPVEWTGPLRANADAMPVVAMQGRNPIRWTDGPDAAADWIDIRTVHEEGGGPLRWTLELAGFPPSASTLDPAQRVIEYGVVIDATGDGNADFVIGISNEAPRRGDYRVWMTNLATGATDEDVGAPYGIPIEFRHPDEQLDRNGPASMTFTFFPGSAPSEVYSGYASGSLRYYAWASMTDAGRVTAWDYAPDAGWLEAKP